MKKINLINMQFGDLTVISSADSKVSEWGSAAQWLCKCICGNEIVVLASQLRNKGWSKTSCGCLSLKRGDSFVNDPKTTSFRALNKRYRMSAKHREIQWDLTEEETTLLFSSNCFYCGIKAMQFFNVYKTKGGKDRSKSILLGDNATIQFNGIDRIESNKGYSLDNVVSCCTICNYAKNSLSTSDFFDWLKRIAIHQGYKL